MFTFLGFVSRVGVGFRPTVQLFRFLDSRIWDSFSPFCSWFLFRTQRKD